MYLSFIVKRNANGKAGNKPKIFLFIVRILCNIFVSGTR